MYDDEPFIDAYTPPPDASTVCGAVRELKWTTDGCALAMAWERGGFSLWSVFGALLLCSAGPQSSYVEL